MSRIHPSIIIAAALVLPAPVSAGEVTGNGQDIEINGRSECAFSGLNDHFPDPRDPGLKTQNYGTMVGQADWIDPQDWDPTGAPMQAIPGFACNPNRWTDLHAE